MLMVTTDTVAGQEIEQSIGFVKGSSVRAKNVGQDILAGLKNLVGGEIKEYRDMMDQSRKMAISQMVEEATEKEADAIVGIRFVSSTISQGVSEVTVYGTAVKFKK